MPLTAISREELARKVAKKIDNEIMGGEHPYDQKLILRMVDDALIEVLQAQTDSTIKAVEGMKFTDKDFDEEGDNPDSMFSMAGYNKACDDVRALLEWKEL